MYDLSGIVYRIWAVGGIILALGIGVIILIIIVNIKMDKKDKTAKECIFPACVVLLAIGIIGYFSYLYYNPIIAVHEGYFFDSHRDSGVAPPLPFTNNYSFTNENDKKPVFYLDIFSKKHIYNKEFEKNKKYRIYYEQRCHVIVKVEELE